MCNVLLHRFAESASTYATLGFYIELENCKMHSIPPNFLIIASAQNYLIYCE